MHYVFLGIQFLYHIFYFWKTLGRLEVPICKASRSVVAWHRVGSGRIGLGRSKPCGMDRAGKAHSRAEVSSSSGSFSLAVFWSRLRHCRLSRSRHRLRFALAFSPFLPALSLSLSLSLSLCLLRSRVEILPGLGISLFWSLQNKNLWLLLLLVCKSSGVVEDLVS